MENNKEVTYKNLKVGEEIHGYSREGFTSFCKGIVKSINPSYVTVLMWGKTETNIDSRSLFEVEMTEQEFTDKYREKAKEILKNIKNVLCHDEIGYHEMWNSWLYGTPYEMAQHCINYKIEIVGYCTDIIPKTALFSNDILDVGVCARYEDGKKFWCHYRYSDIENMLEHYKTLIE